MNAIFLDGREPEIRINIWSAADIFISLSDNIQETFGLTPIEAMANGLPAIVSDTVRLQLAVLLVVNLLFAVLRAEACQQAISRRDVGAGGRRRLIQHFSARQ